MHSLLQERWVSICTLDDVHDKTYQVVELTGSRGKGIGIKRWEDEEDERADSGSDRA